MKSYVLDLRQRDDRATSIIQKKHEGDLVLAEEALELILRGWTEFASQKQRPDNPLESARLFLVTRSFNSLRMALPILEQGYYQQAMALTRMAMEDQLIAHDMEIHTSTLDTLLSGKGRLYFPSMAKRISPEAKAAWDSDYSTLSRYATHPQLTSLEWLNSTGPDGLPNLLPGSSYDMEKILVALYYLLGELVKVMETMAKVCCSAGIDWDANLVSGYISVMENIERRRRRISKWAREQVEE